MILHVNQGFLLSQAYKHLEGTFAYRAPNWRKPATCKQFFFKTNLFKEWMKKFVVLLMKEKWLRMKLSLSFVQCTQKIRAILLLHLLIFLFKKYVKILWDIERYSPIARLKDWKIPQLKTFPKILKYSVGVQ